MTQIYPGLFAINNLTGTVLIVLSTEYDLINVLQFNKTFRRQVRYDRRQRGYFKFTTNHHLDLALK